MPKKKLKIAVLMGGPSSEHEVSLATAEMICKALDSDQYLIRPVKITKEGKWLAPPSYLSLKSGGVVQDLSLRLIRQDDVLKSDINNRPDLVFIAMHGQWGEDGKLQSLLEMAGIPYTGSGVLASALAIDKAKSFELLEYHGFNIAPYVVFSKYEWSKNKNRLTKEIRAKINFPNVVKPNLLGSSVGVSIARTPDKLLKSINLAFKQCDECLIQEFISGAEFTCGVLDNGRGEAEALMPTEIVPKKNKFFDYKSKYESGGADEIIPPKSLSARQIFELRVLAKKAHTAIGASGMSRSDFIFSSKDNKFYILEINTIPGMTPMSLLPKGAAACGLNFPQLLDRIVKAALNRFNRPE